MNTIDCRRNVVPGDVNLLIGYAKDLLKKGRALETEIMDRIANGEIVPEETQHNIAEHSRLLDDLELLLSTSTDRGDAPGNK